MAVPLTCQLMAPSHILTSHSAPSHYWPLLKWSVINDLHNRDHFPIKISLKTPASNNTAIKSCKYIHHRADWVKYSEKAESVILNKTFSGSSNRDAALFIKSIRTAANKHIPQTKNKSFIQKRSVPWWNDLLSALRIQKMRSWQNFKANPIHENLITYRKTNAKFRQATKRAKRESFENFTKTIHRNTPMTEIWNKINRISQRHYSSTIGAISTRDETLTDPFLIANEFGRKWADYASDNNFSETFKSYKLLSNSTSASYTVDKTTSLLEEPITMIELSSCLSKVKGITPGLDRVSYQMIKALSHNSKQKLLNLYNTIFKSGVIPQNWKLAIIIPIPKTKNAFTTESFRPISLLPCISKIIERIIATRLLWLFEKKNLIAKEQVAFKPNRGCDDALLHLGDYISKTLSARNDVTALSIDFEKAFAESVYMSF